MNTIRIPTRIEYDATHMCVISAVYGTVNGRMEQHIERRNDDYINNCISAGIPVAVTTGLAGQMTTEELEACSAQVVYQQVGEQ